MRLSCSTPRLQSIHLSSRFRFRVWAPLVATLSLLAASSGWTLHGQGIGTLSGPFPRSNAAQSFGQPTSSLVQQELRLGGDYLVGRGVAKDPVQAAWWYRKAADQGDPDAENQLGYFYLWGIGVDRDETEAFRWFARAAAAGCQAAKLNLAVMYFKGVGTPRDSSIALDLMTQLAEKGNARAQGYLGIIYFTGDGAAKNLSVAEKWLTKAAKGKNPEAEYTLGVFWSTVAGHDHDPAKAVRYFRSAAHFGYVPAMHALGILLEQHPEIQPSPSDEALLWLERAAQAGSWQSAAALGALARDGHERPQSLADAFRWFTIATKQGGANAQRVTLRDLDRCRQVLSEDEQDREQEAAGAWLAQHPHTDIYLFTGSGTSRFPIDEVYAPSSQ